MPLNGPAPVKAQWQMMRVQVIIMINLMVVIYYGDNDNPNYSSLYSRLSRGASQSDQHVPLRAFPLNLATPEVQMT